MNLATSKLAQLVMKPLPKVAVILINRNGCKLTEACVRSLVHTKYSNLLIIITDNGSQQDDLDQLANLRRTEKSVVIHPLGYNAGFTKANNAGVRLALDQDADFLWILNNDTEVREDAIELSLKAFSDCALNVNDTLVSSIITYADNDNIWCNGLRDLAWVNFPRSVDKLKPALQVAQPGLVLKTAEYSVGCSMFFAREFVTKHGLMNEDYFIYYDDLDYSLGRNNVFIQQPLVKHKVSSTSGFKGSGRFTAFQSFLFAKNGIHFYFRKKKIPFLEKVIYLSFTTWVFVLLYVRDFSALTAHFKGLWAGLTNAQSPKNS
jgi:GT2 family glycosyltransferase